MWIDSFLIIKKYNMFNIFKRKCKHSKLLKEISLRHNGGKYYHYLLIFKCQRCGREFLERGGSEINIKLGVQNKPFLNVER